MISTQLSHLHVHYALSCPCGFAEFNNSHNFDGGGDIGDYKRRSSYEKFTKPLLK
jgi:hypothetical protein